jgi:C-terminal processing protease CtpA/Prc
LRLTTAKYFTPKGREIQGKGITPDVVVEEAKAPQAEDEQSKQQTPPRNRRQIALPGDDLSDDLQLQKAVDFLKQQVKQGGKSVKAG